MKAIIVFYVISIIDLKYFMYICTVKQYDMFEPVIKWTGSKRSQAESIISFFPDKIKTYYEPFCGGASILNRLISSSIKVEKYICGDINQGLIDLWNAIKERPFEISVRYRELWEELNSDNNIPRKRSFYESIRKRYNETRDPLDFMFLMRTCTNGTPRYNSNGMFNTSFHLKRDGISPDKLSSIIEEWSKKLNENNVEFVCCSYSEHKPNHGDFLYLDPPYAGTKGIYSGGINLDVFWNWIENLPCGYALSFNGTVKGNDNTFPVPKHLYDKHEMLYSGNSSFGRILGNDKNCVVEESLYIKY